MSREPRITAAVATVLAAFLAEPDTARYGLELMRATGHPSGTLYPVLARLQDAGWVDAEWEEATAAQSTGRPPRRYYRLTADGVVAARRELAALHRALGVPGRPATGLA
ncbi:PadR family transcriptional regulator [Actinocatenispora rupis]|uniref:Transcriptional regulator n=1 Tax=Actinocatenispora rupis TaxID=519421 RepID=A0A8J3NF97_9ACTN|nr:PadR family transcriptional regulator [Actinocatenispora rupis]GID15007.1 transcriptional regulator [Actinocatenispora rupis]